MDIHGYGTATARGRDRQKNLDGRRTPCAVPISATDLPTYLPIVFQNLFSYVFVVHFICVIAFFKSTTLFFTKKCVEKLFQSIDKNQSQNRFLSNFLIAFLGVSRRGEFEAERH
jgi:hypothetical protein